MGLPGEPKKTRGPHGGGDCSETRDDQPPPIEALWRIPRRWLSHRLEDRSKALHSPNLVEGSFPELRPKGVLGSPGSARRTRGGRGVDAPALPSTHRRSFDRLADHLEGPRGARVAQDGVVLHARVVHGHLVGAWPGRLERPAVIGPRVEDALGAQRGALVSELPLPLARDCATRRGWPP